MPELFIAIAFLIFMVWFLFDLWKQKRQLDGFAKGISRIKRECEQSGTSFAPAARAAADILKHKSGV